MSQMKFTQTQEQSSGQAEFAERYSNDQMREVVRRAEQIRAEREGSVSRENLTASASELGISEADLREAERQLVAERQARAASAAKNKLIAAVTAAVLALFLIFSYNSLNGRLSTVQKARADLSAQLQRRSELAEQVNSVVQQGGDRKTLQVQIEGSENRVAEYRKRFNEAATNYNRAAGGFPLGLARPLFGMPGSVPPFEASNTAVPKL